METKYVLYKMSRGKKRYVKQIFVDGVQYTENINEAKLYKQGEAESLGVFDWKMEIFHS